MKVKKTLSAIFTVALLASLLLLSIGSTSAMSTSETTTTTSVVNSISLSSTGNGDVSWSADGYSELGFKVVWSKNQGPTYPTRSGDKYQYFSDPNKTSATVTAFNGSGTYFVRGCEYLGGECGTYSNEIEVYLEGTEEKTAPETFKDVSETHENAEAITYLKDEGVVVGYEDGTYKPSQEINRAEFLKIVMIVGGYDTSDEGDCFYDVEYQWYAPYVCKAKTLGLVDGYPDGYYRPDRNINFAEASKIVVLALGLPTDESNDENWYQMFVVSLEDVYAIPGTIYSFDEFINRGEMAEMTWRVKTENQYEESKTYETISTKSTETVTKTGTTESEVNSITIADDGDGNVSWTADGESSLGFKVVWSKDSSPTYPPRSGDQYIYKSDPAATSATINAFDGAGTYHVRVCEYLGGECGVYSNEIQVVLDGSVGSGVNSIVLSSFEGGIVNWVVDGYSDNGYKIVWSKYPGPTYPTRDDENDEFIYETNPFTTSTELYGHDGEGDYYVRVCEYLSGSCGVYSNEIVVTLADVAPSVTALTLTDDGDGNVSWVAEGYSEYGYKVVWSMTPGPTYPLREGDQYHYYSDPLAVSGTVTDFDGTGTYYVRVCEYLGEECGYYSNEIEVEL